MIHAIDCNAVKIKAALFLSRNPFFYLLFKIGKVYFMNIVSLAAFFSPFASQIGVQYHP